MDNATPYVAAAVFCEKLLQEQDGVLSAIRIVDTFAVSVPPGTPPDATPVVAVSGLVALKSGNVVGERNIRIILVDTKGERTELSPKGGWPVVFQGGEHGVQIRLDFNLAVKNYGLAWIEVMCGDDVLLTRMPIRLKRRDEDG